ncbi:MAG: hypothetical protein ABSG36_08620 [Acidimicrobiales bacterium]|jgi:photosystem II stability/assembly factor-like uncharacterized protein
MTADHEGAHPITTASSPAHERFEDRLLDAFLDHFEDIRGDCGTPPGTAVARRSHRGPIALTLLAVVAAGSLGVAVALHFATNPTGTTHGLHWALAGYVASPWEGTADQGLSVFGPYHQALACPSATTCFVEGPAKAGQGAEIEATYNAGKTWHLAGAEGATALSNVSCPRTRACALLEGRRNNEPLFVETTDGGTTWLARPAPSWLSPLALDAASGPAPPGSPGSLISMSCRSASSCSVLASSGKPTGPSFASVTMDGGRTWSSPVPVLKPFWELQCFANGKCLAAGPSGTAYSIDNGLRWSLSSGWPNEGAFYFSCATTARCTALSHLPGASAESLLVSSDGGESWSVVTAKGLPAGVGFTSLACPTSSDCWLSGNVEGEQLLGKGAVLVSSLNGGRTWGTSLLPQGTGIVFAVSCPDQDACFASATRQPPGSSSATSSSLVLLADLVDGNHHAAA